MTFLIYISVFVFGLIVGSFLNAVIWRLHSGESIVKDRSHCPKCGHVLSWKELVPVLSFIIQRRKCRECGEKISFQYPAVELATGLLFLFIFTYYGLRITDYGSIFFLWIVAAGLIVIFVYDLRHYIIPDKVLFSLIGLTVAARLFDIWIFGNSDFIWNLEFGIWNLGNVFNGILFGTIAAFPFAVLYFISRGRWMGFGDVKYIFFMGLFLGFPQFLTALFIAFVGGAIIGVTLITAGKKHLQSRLPFGPFLIVSTFIALFWGSHIVDWYLRLFI